MKRIKYIGFYNHLNTSIPRVSALSAVNKMNYVIDSLNSNNVKVDLISFSWLEKSYSKIFKKSEFIIDNNNTFKYFASFNFPNKILSIINIILIYIKFLFYIIWKVNEGEKIIVYHSMWAIIPIYILKKIKRIYLILQVEEIYSDVHPLHKKFRKYELSYFRLADSFIFSTELLNDKVNLGNKNFIVLYGSYHNYKPANIKSDKIRIIYSGIIDEYKAGAFNALEIAKYLNRRFELIIIGFGDVDKLLNKIKEDENLYQCKVSYKGLFKGQDYIKELLLCDIGLNTQSIQGQYVDTSFPSKILTYLGTGLEVVSCKIRCLEVSKINSNLHYYIGEDPQDIASCIRNITPSSFKNNQIIQRLDLEFKQDLCDLIEK